MVYQSEGLNNEKFKRKVNLEIFDKILASELKGELTGAPIYLQKQGGLSGDYKTIGKRFH